MTIRNLAYTALVGAVAVAFVIGSAIPSEAAKKKKTAAAAPAPQTPTCLMVTARGPVCATKGGQKFTYFNACYAAKDQATKATPGACKEAKAGGGKKKKKA
ncbi:MAG TPA: hypothetical protein VKG24_30505 [Pseudolabrys sp.]|jgi:hypothetical protein|nr:hypothetical protein [Pseudolabrys sp.]